MRGLSGKVAFVTGAGRGIGKGIAQRLREEGCKVALADLDQAGAQAAAKEIGGGAVGLAIDVAKLASARAAVAEAERQLGPVDILVNNAGWDRVEPFLQNSEETWDKVLAIDLRGPINCCRAVLDSMIARGAWTNRLDKLGRRPRRLQRRGGLLGRQRRRDRVQQDARARDGAPRDQRQLRMPGANQHADAPGTRGA